MASISRVRVPLCVGLGFDQVQGCFTSLVGEFKGLLGTGSPGRSPRLAHSS